MNRKTGNIKERKTKMVNLKLAELRKMKNLTQQELGEELGISNKNISKWENGVTMPDITVLPILSEYFEVTVDEILGLVPLSKEYCPSQTGTKEYWEKKIPYLMLKEHTLWNMDYIKFLIEKVWEINRPVRVLDCGCGYGALGILLLPLLPQGSSYTGIDFSKKMLDTGEKIFRQKGLKGRFVCNDILKINPSEKYDIVISQSILRHINDGEILLQKMIDFAAKGGLIVSIESNRENEEIGLYIEGMDYSELCNHEEFRLLWKKEQRIQGRDYAIAMKIPHYMRKYGLENVNVRLNDRVTYLEPGQLNYEQTLDNIIKAENWDSVKTEEECEEIIAYFMNHGMTRKAALAYCEKNNKIAKFIKNNKGKIAMTKYSGSMISYGWIANL